MAAVLAAAHRQVYSSFDPLNKLLNRAWIDSHHDAADESYRWLVQFWAENASLTASRNFDTTATSSIDYKQKAAQYDEWGNYIGRGIPPPPHQSGNGGALQRIGRFLAVKLYVGSNKAVGGEKEVQIHFEPKDCETLWVYRHGALFHLIKTGARAGPDDAYDAMYGGGSGRQNKGEGVTIRCFGRSREPLLKLLKEAHKLYADAQERQTSLQIMVYDSSMLRWQPTHNRNGRSLQSIILPQDIKDRLIVDVREFLASGSWYSDRGIAWKRGYMLHGPPGCGKSSTIQALASEFSLPVYILPVSSMSMNDSTLLQAMRSIQTTCVLVMEDIDVWFKSRRNLESQKSSSAWSDPYGMPPPPPGWSAPPRRSGRAGRRNAAASSADSSLSALLNVIDGLESSEGRIVVMTTNQLDGLDPALVRPGRVDGFFEYSRATAGQAEQLFIEFFRGWHAELTSGAASDSKEGSDAEREESEEQLEKRKQASLAAGQREIVRLAGEWKKKITDGEHSVAELQGMLLHYKRDPRLAVENTDKWVQDARADKQAKAIKAAEEEREEKEDLMAAMSAVGGRPPVPAGMDIPDFRGRRRRRMSFDI